MSLETALKETKQRFQEEQEKAAKEDADAREFSKRVVVALRAPDATVEHMKDLQGLLPEAASVHMEALRRSYPNLDRLVLAPNVSTFSALGGHVLVLGAGQAISQLSHVVNVVSPFGLTMAVRVRDAGYTSARDMRDKYGAKAVEYVQSLPRTGPTIDAHMPRPGETEDSARWPVFFPTKRAHVGLYASPAGELYLIARSHAGAEVLPAARAVVETAGTTAQSFVEDSRVRWMEGVAYRNTARLLHGLARALGFAVPETQDYQAHSGSQRLIRYKLARPDIVHRHNTQRITDQWGEPRAAFFRDVVDGGQTVGGSVLVQSDITKGYSLSEAQAPVSNKLPYVTPVTTDKIPVAERIALTIDQRDHYVEKISSLMPRRHLLTHHKYRDSDIGVPLSPVVVVRA